MSGAKKSVDEIWKELNARTAPPRSRTTGVPGFGIPGVSTHTRLIPKHQDGHAAQSKHVAGDVSINRQVTKPSVTYDPAAAGVSHEELQQYMSTLQRTLNCLTDPDRSARRAAVAALQNKLLRGDAATPKAGPPMLQVGRVDYHNMAVPAMPSFADPCLLNYTMVLSNGRAGMWSGMHACL